MEAFFLALLLTRILRLPRFLLGFSSIFGLPSTDILQKLNELMKSSSFFSLSSSFSLRDNVLVWLVFELEIKSSFEFWKVRSSSFLAQRRTPKLTSSLSWSRLSHNFFVSWFRYFLFLKFESIVRWNSYKFNDKNLDSSIFFHSQWNPIKAKTIFLWANR